MTFDLELEVRVKFKQDVLKFKLSYFIFKLEQSHLNLETKCSKDIYLSGSLMHMYLIHTAVANYNVNSCTFDRHCLLLMMIDWIVSVTPTQYLSCLYYC